MPEIEVNIEIYCARCRAGICNNANPRKTPNRGQPCFEIEPCEKCLSDAEDAGYEKGYEDAKAEFKE